MTISLATPSVDGLAAAIDALRDWQVEGDPLQLHPGDIGWHWRFGADATAGALRIWSGDGRILAVGFLDGPDVFRLTTAPDLRQDAALAERIARDVAESGSGILPAGEAYFEAPNEALVREVLAGRGWVPGDSWTPLHRGLSEAVEAVELRVEIVDDRTAAERVTIQHGSFPKSTLTIEKLARMNQGHRYDDARDLIGFDKDGNAVGAITVWSAGRGRPGLIEPLGVIPEFRGHGYGREMTLAGAAALRELGSSSALVCTETTRIPSVATYRSAGFTALPERFDLGRT